MYEYNRTAEQNVFLGLISADDVAQHKQQELANKNKLLIQIFPQI